jgi:hypothetical protein
MVQVAVSVTAAQFECSSAMRVSWNWRAGRDAGVVGEVDCSGRVRKDIDGEAEGLGGAAERGPLWNRTPEYMVGSSSG